MLNALGLSRGFEREISNKVRRFTLRYRVSWRCSRKSHVRKWVAPAHSADHTRNASINWFGVLRLP
jgi:hypothetical protein